MCLVGTQHDLQTRFKSCESDLAKVITAATQLYMRLEEIVIDCRRVRDVTGCVRARIRVRGLTQCVATPCPSLPLHTTGESV